MSEEEVLNAVENARYDQQNTKYLEEIDAEIDEGIVDLVNYFNHTVGHPTEYCCSGLLRDHYNIEMLKNVDLSNRSYTVYENIVTLPYITFESVYHTWTGEKTIIDGDFHTFRGSIPPGLDIHITEDRFETTHTHKYLNFKFNHKLTHKDSLKDSSTHTHKYTCYIGSSNSLSAILESLCTDLKLYDKLLEHVIEMFQIQHTYPSSIFMFTRFDVDRETGDIQCTVSNLQGYPASISDDSSVELRLSGELRGDKLWEIVGSLDQIKEHICNNDKYVENMPSEHPFQNATF